MSWGSKSANSGQFPKGRSGNPRGRPRKAERAYTPSQERRDILGLMEETMDITLGGKKRKLPIILGIYYRAFQKALDGNEKMILAVISLRRDLLNEHRLANPDLVETLEIFEGKIASTVQGKPSPEYLDLLNAARKRSRGT